MIKKNYFIYLTAVALLLLAGGAFSVFAQTAPVRGKVQFVKEDGTKVPAANVVVDVYRTDSKGKLPSGKTDKKGEFGFAGFPVGQTFMLVISGPEIKAQAFPGIRAGMDSLQMTVYAGDGKQPNEEEARQMLSAPKTSAAVTPETPKASPEDVAAAKKAKEEYDKKVAEVTEKNKKAESTNAVVTKALQEGVAAYQAKNYDLAIVKFGEGADADPNFVGSAPVLLNNKGLVLRQRGTDTYNVGVKAAEKTEKDAKIAAAKKDLQDSLDAFTKSYQLLKNAQPADIPDQNVYNKNKYDALNGIVEVYRLMGLTRTIDSSKSAEAKAAFQDYMSVETDATKKAKAQFILADVLREAGDFDNAVPEYRKALEASPDNPDVLAGLGLSLFSVGVTNSDKAQMQEGLNFMEKFAQVAPPTHPLKSSVADAVTYLKTQEKLTPQKVAPAKKRGN